MIKKIIWGCVYTVCSFLLAWVIVSYIEILGQNMYGIPAGELNFFKILIQLQGLYSPFYFYLKLKSFSVLCNLYKIFS